MSTSTPINKTSRPSIDETYMEIAKIVAKRSTCRHRDQGAVLVKDNRVISTGYNGSPPEGKHCINLGYCSKAEGLPCMAEGLHGESNAIITAARFGISTWNTTMYSVYSPCRTCCNILKVAGVTKIIYLEVYSGFPEGPEYLKELGIECQKM